MKLEYALLLAAPMQICAASLPFFQQTPLTTLEEEFPVDGDNPLGYCTDPKDDILEITSVNLSPNPPEPGQTLTIEAEGFFHEPVERGSKIHLEVKYGLIKLIKTDADLCDEIEANTDLKCPLQGKQKFVKQVDIPSQVPPGRYAVLADVYTKDAERVTCLQARDIVF
jgi:hypothetical protein